MDFKTHKAVIVLADIGGYTRFIKFHDTALVHAEKIITDLLESVIDAAEFPLTLNKLEGDAAMFYALGDGNEEAVVQSALRQTAAFFAAFTQRRADLEADTVCTCSACQGMDQLSIKAIVHCGDIVLKKVRTFEELAGEPVITAHRLLKNSVEKDQYILVTERAAKLGGGVLGAGVEAIEQCDGIGAVGTVVFDPPTSPIPAAVRKSSWPAKAYQLARLGVYGIAKKLRMGAIQQFPKLAGL
jgi:class 3 adenylate cyclase